MGRATETFTSGALALAESEPEFEEIQATPPPGPEIVPSLSAEAVPQSPAAGNTDHLREAVVQALNAGGHSTAAVLLEEGKWIQEASSVRIEVPCKPTMIRITFNANAEKLIRQALSQAGAPSRFLIVPGEGQQQAGNQAKARTAPEGSIEAEARSNPAVLQAQSLFNAEIVSVVDLRT